MNCMAARAGSKPGEHWQASPFLDLASAPPRPCATRTLRGVHAMTHERAEFKLETTSRCENFSSRRNTLTVHEVMVRNCKVVGLNHSPVTVQGVTVIIVPGHGDRPSLGLKFRFLVPLSESPGPVTEAPKPKPQRAPDFQVGWINLSRRAV
jgi:hypothetical protein